MKKTRTATESPKSKQLGKRVLKWFIDLIFILIGAILYSISLHCFTSPNDIATGGVGGIATIINDLTGMNLGLLFGLINVPLVIIGLIFLGKKMMLKTLIAILVISVGADNILNYFNVPVYENGDRLLAAIFGGVLLGAGLGIIYLRDGTSGGTDIINKLINKKLPYISLGIITMSTDVIVVITSMVVYGNIESGFYAIIAIFICSKVIDLILYGSFEGKMLLIFSDKYDEISDYIMNNLNRGVTWLDGTGAYSKEEKHVICCAVHKNEYTKIKRKVKEIDSHAFIIITNAGEVLGSGFQENT